MTAGAIVWRAPALSFRASPFVLPPAKALAFESDALLVSRDGRIAAFGLESGGTTPSARWA